MVSRNKKYHFTRKDPIVYTREPRKWRPKEKQFKGNVVTRTLRYARYWEKNGFHPTRMMAKQYIKIFSNIPNSQKQMLDERWEWLMGLPEAGGSLELQEFLWQAMMHCYRWGKSLGVRGCKDTTLVLIPRKMGKTDAAARQGLAALYFSRSKAPKVHSIATRQDQAGISYDFAATILQGSEMTVGRKTSGDEWAVGPMDTSGIRLHTNGGVWKTLPSTPKKLDGLQADLIIIDEGAQVEDKLENVISSGMSDTVEDQHLLSISTAGGEPNWFTRAVFESVDRIEADMEPDINILVWAVPETKHNEEDSEFDPNNDVGKLETWKKTNPCFGITMKKERIESDYRKAKQSQSKMIEFCRTRINMFTSKDVASLCSYAIQKQVSNKDNDELVEKKLYTLPTSMGIDISATGDPTALCIAAQDDDGVIYFKTQNFICRSSYEFRMEQFRANILEHLVNTGELIITGHERLDYEEITQFAAKWVEKYNPPSIYSDTATGGMHFRTLMVGDLGIPVLDFGVMQGYPGTKRQLSDQTKNYFIDCLFSEMLKCPDSDCYRWELNNCAVKTYADDRKDIWKLAGQDAVTAMSIDGVYATLHAIFPFAINRNTEKLPDTDEEWDLWGVSP